MIKILATLFSLLLVSCNIFGDENNDVSVEEEPIDSYTWDSVDVSGVSAQFAKPLIGFEKTGMHDTNFVNMALLRLYVDVPEDFKAKHFVESYIVYYESPGIDGNADTLSGRFFRPIPISNPIDSVLEEVFPILNLNHGTILSDREAPSVELPSQATYWGRFLIASQGWNVALPDYIGFGADSAQQQAYLLKEFEAKAGVDMVRAVRVMLDSLDKEYKDEIYIGGYSQGGKVAMEVFSKMEQEYPLEFNVQGVYPGAGPYNVDTTFMVMMRKDTMPYPALAPFIFSIYNTYYQMGYADSSILQVPFDTLLTDKFNGRYDLGDVNTFINNIGDSLPKLVSQVIQPSLIEDMYQYDHHFRQKFRENSFMPWVTSTPLKLFHSSIDNVVAFENSSWLQNYYQNELGMDVALEDCIEMNGNIHVKCYFWYLIELNDWFQVLSEV